MPRSKEFPEDLRKKVVEAHQSGKGYNHIAKSLGLQKTTIRSIVHKWRRFGTVVTLPRSGRPPKITPTARRDIIQNLIKNPYMTAKDLQATLASTNIHVHDSTIRKILDINTRPSLTCFKGIRGIQQSDHEENPDVETSGESSHKIKSEEDEQALDNLEDLELGDTSALSSGKDEVQSYRIGGNNQDTN